MKTLQAVPYSGGLIFVSDEEIKAGDWYLDTYFDGGISIVKCFKIENDWIIPTDESDVGDNGEAPKDLCKKIITQTTNLSIQDVPYVEIGEESVDIEKLITREIRKYVVSLNVPDNEIYRNNELLIMSCFSKSMEIIEETFKAQGKRYSEERWDFMWNRLMEFLFNVEGRAKIASDFILWQKSYLQSLNQPSLDSIESIEVETEWVNEDYEPVGCDFPDRKESPTQHTKEGKTFLIVNKINYKP